MAEDANANIRIDIDTSSAVAAIKSLQSQIARFHTEMARGGAVAGQNAAKLQQNLINSINAGGQFQTGMTKVQSTTEAFTTALEKNKLSMGQYFRYAGASTKTFGRMFRGEFETITKVATERVKDLQTQYISMGRDANGALRSIKIRPLTLDMNNLATQTMVTAQKQQLYNQLLKQGSTNLLNFGKNTQWAGRQLMVGFTLPLTLFASTAAKSFMEIEKQVIRIRRVYGDFSTTVKETDQMIDSIKSLAGEYTKYGVAVSDTLGLAAEAAAAGKSGQELLAQVAQATRLAVLGNVEQTQALETTMSVTNAFGVATEDLAKKIDFLNAVENQSVTSIEDLTIAIPKAGPVVQQLGGDVEDLAFFLTAMKEGGINASEGANALKSGLAALINPTGKAKEMLKGFGINIEKIVNSNKGDIKGLVIDFASALDTLDPLSRARAIEQLFGKFQFSRLSTLFQNVIGEGTQASRVLELTKATTQELAILSQRELKKVEDTTTFKFQKAFADFQAAIAPVGEQFLKAVTPIIEFGTKLLNQFNGMSDGAKSFAVILTTVVAGIGPVLLMTVGLVANGVANLIKMFQALGTMFKKSGADTTTLGLQTDYMTQQQLEAAAVAASLNQSHSRLTQTFSVEAAALNSLTAAYQKAITAQRGFSGAGTVPRSSTRPKKYAVGGVVRGPGSGTSDSIPAMLSNGEAVIPAKQVKKYGGFIEAMISGNLPGFARGGIIGSPIKGILSRYLKGMGPSENIKQPKIISYLSQKEKDAYYRAAMNADSNKMEKIVLIAQERSGGISPFAGPGRGIPRAQSPESLQYSPKDLWFSDLVELLDHSVGSDKIESAQIKTLKSRVAKYKKDPSKMPTGLRAAIMDFFSVHRSSNSNIKAKPMGKYDVKGNMFGDPLGGPGTYLSSTLKSSDQSWSDYSGNNIYRISKTPDEFKRTLLGKGYIESEDQLAKLIVNFYKNKKGEISKVYSDIDTVKSIVSQKGWFDQNTKANDPFIKHLMQQGYQGSALGGATEIINWKIGQPGIGLKPYVAANSPIGYANGVVSVPGPKGRGDIVPAMLSPGEAVIPAAMAKKYGGLIKGMVSGSIPGYATGKIDFAHLGPGKQVSAKNLLASGSILPPHITRNLQELARVLPNAVVNLKNAYGVSMDPAVNRSLGKAKGALSGDVAKQFTGKDISSRYGEMAKLSGTDINNSSLQKQLATYDKTMSAKIKALQKDGVTRIVDTEKQLKALPANQKKFTRSLETLDKQVIKEIGKENKQLVDLRQKSMSTVRDIRIGEGISQAEKAKLLKDKNASAALSRRISSKGEARRIWRSFQAKSAGGFMAMPEENVSTTPSPQQKAAETRRQNAAARLQATQAQQYKRDERNARRREQYAARKAAAVPPAPKPGIGSRIAGGIRGMGPMGGMMAAGAVGAGVSMIPGMEGLGAAIGIVGPLLMMLPGPIAAVAAGLAAMVGIVMSLNAAQEEQKRKAIELANAQTMSINAINKMSEDFGTVSATQLRQSKEDVKLSGVSEKSLSAGQQYLSNTTSGQALLSGVKAQQAAGVSTADIAKSISSNLATAVSQNVITQKQGQEIIAALGIMSGNSGVATGATGQFRSYTENLGKTAGMIAAEDLQMIKAQSANAGGARGRAGGSPELAAQAMNASGRAFAGIDAINAQYDSLVKQAKTQKEINALEKERTLDINTQRSLAQQLLAEVEKQKVAIGSQAFDSAFLSDIKAQFGEESDMYKTAQKVNDLKDGKFKTKLQMDFAGGNVGLVTAQFLIDSARNDKDFERKYNLSLNVEFTNEAEHTINRLKALGYALPKGIGDPAGDGNDTTKCGICGSTSHKTKDHPDGGGDGGDKKLNKYNKKLDKRQKALNVVQLQEDAINKKYEQRAKALEDIAKLNERIAQGQQDQLDIANALASGDIATAAKAVQSARASAAQQSAQAQQEGLDKARQNELNAVSFGGMTRASLEASMIALQMAIARREYKLAASGGLMRGYSVGGKVMSYFAGGGKPRGSDTIPAMLTPGEFVIKRPAVQNFGVKNLETINSGKSPNGSVYNYSVTVNAGSNANADQIASTVMSKIKKVEGYRIRGNSQ